MLLSSLRLQLRSQPNTISNRISRVAMGLACSAMATLQARRPCKLVLIQDGSGTTPINSMQARVRTELAPVDVNWKDRNNKISNKGTRAVGGPLKAIRAKKTSRKTTKASQWMAPP